MEEKRVARERERASAREYPSSTRSAQLPVYLRQRSLSSERNQHEQPFTPISAARSEANFGRGRGLADLEGRFTEDAAAKRLQQMELQVRFTCAFTGVSYHQKMCSISDRIVR